MSTDVAGRLLQHNSGKVQSTKPYKPWSIIYEERFQSRTAARKKEVKLKTNFSEREKILRK
jgi:putative endonuclease